MAVHFFLYFIIINIAFGNPTNLSKSSSSSPIPKTLEHALGLRMARNTVGKYRVQGSEECAPDIQTNKEYQVEKDSEIQAKSLGGVMSVGSSITRCGNYST